MTKKSKKKTKRPSATQQQPKQAPIEQMAGVRSFVKKEAATIIVLVLSAIAFVTALAIIHSEDFLHEAGEVVSVYGKNVEFETATVNEVQTQEVSYDEVITDAPVGSQELSVTVTSGRYKGEQLVVNNYFGALGGVPANVGESVTLAIKNHDDGTHSANVYDLNRAPVMAAYFLLFSVVVVAIGRITGLKSLIGLLFTGVCLFTILIPLIIKGAPAIGTTFVVCAYVSLVCFTILGGVHRKSVCAFLGTVAGMFFALLFGVVVQYIARIDGLQSAEVETLYQLGVYQNIRIDIRGLLVASIIICSLGAVMDVAMSISSTIEEIHAANPALTQKELFESGMNVGRDAAGTMTNTLILALIGGDLALMVYLYAGQYSANQLLATSYVGIETISGLSSSLGMILAIPLTALISSTLITRGRFEMSS